MGGERRSGRRSRWLGGAGVCAWLVAAPGAVLGQVDLEALASTVEAREIAFARSMADRDLEAFRSFVSEEAVFFNGNTPIRGRDAVVEAWAPFFESPEAPFGWHPDVVQVLESGTLALSSGRVHSPGGEPAGRFNSVWRLEADGVWRVVFDKGS